MRSMHPAAYESFRDTASSVVSPTDFISMSADELLALQAALGVIGGWGVWEFPKEFMPDGQMQGISFRRCESDQLLTDGEVDEARIRQAWTEIVRYGVVRSLVPGARALAKPSTISTELKLLIRAARIILSRPCKTTCFWSQLSNKDFSGIGCVASTLANTLRRFRDQGFISDCPTQDPEVEGEAAERDRFEEDAPNESGEVVGKSWQPFPDKFTSECGWRSIHIIRVLGPTLLSALEAALSVPVRTRHDGKSLHPRNQQLAAADVRDAVISEWRWCGPDGESLNELGYELLLKATKRRGMVAGQQLPAFVWPPKSFADAWGLLPLLQGAHLFPVCLASGPRASEVCGFLENCLVEAPVVGKRIHGKTYKLVTDIGGRERDFASPEIVVSALLQQIRLARLVKNRGGVRGDHIWVHLRSLGRGRMGEKHLLLSQFLDDYASKLGLRHLLVDCSRVHIHRFRKTLARIVALSLVNSPSILMDCFGHEDPNMTIRSYILSDREIARDVLVIQRELVVLMAVDIVNDSESLGGAVGEQLRKRKADFLQFLGKSEFEPQDAYEFARRETFDGRSWMMVLPGIYCTLPTGEGGGMCKRPGGCKSSILPKRLSISTTYRIS